MPDAFAPGNCTSGEALDLHTFEDVEVYVLMMGFGGDGSAGILVPDDEIGIGAKRDGTLARVDVENLRGVGGGDGDEFLWGEAAGVDAVGGGGGGGGARGCSCGLRCRRCRWG